MPETSKYIRIDGQEYPVAITSLKRKGDILDLTATRTSDGVLHRDVIGTFYNYTLNIYSPDPAVYEQLWWVLTAPVASHSVQLPYQPEAFNGYFSSCQDDIQLITPDGIKAKGLSCNLTATRPSRTAGQ